MNIAKKISRWLVTILTFSIIILTGYNSNPSMAASNTQVPQWVLSPPPDTASALYGVGERSSLDQAKKAALAEIAGKLGTAIKADTTITASIRNNQAQESFVENIKSNVASTEFSDFEVVNIEQGSGRYWVLVKVDRSAMSKNLRFKIGQTSRELNLDFSDFNKQTSLKKARSGTALQEKLDQLKTYAMTLRAIDPAYNVVPVFDDARSKEQQIRQAKDSLQVKIEYDDETWLLAKKLESLLTDSKIKVTSKGSRKGKTVINISSNVKYFNILKDYHAKMIVDIQAIDEAGKVLATSNHTISGVSRTSQEMALEQANIKLANRLSEQGLLESIGF